MRKLLLFTVIYLLAFAPIMQAQAQSETRRYLYLSTPDAAQVEGQADGNGILIFDIDDDHKLVRRIDIPEFSEGTRGFAETRASSMTKTPFARGSRSVWLCHSPAAKKLNPPISGPPTDPEARLYP